MYIIFKTTKLVMIAWQHFAVIAEEMMFFMMVSSFVSKVAPPVIKHIVQTASSVTRCASCSDAYCEGCVEMEACDECQEASCEDCLYSCDM